LSPRRSIAGLLPFIVGAGLVTPALAAPALWKVSDADSSVWLFGSIHLMDAGREWRTAQLDDLVRTADHVYFEIVLDAATYATITRLTLTDGYSHDGRRLDDYLTAEQAEKLHAALEASGLPYPGVRQMRPWLVDLTLSQRALTGDATDSAIGAGVEILLSAEVPAERERGLETAEEQIAMLSERSDAEQVDSLMTTVEMLDGTEFSLATFVDSWITADLDTLQREMEASLGPVGSPYYDRLLTTRNRNWTDQIAQLLAGNDQSLIVVGAGHLVGPVGVPTLLEQRGFKVERIDGPADAH
jgi:uncharacterized protein